MFEDLVNKKQEVKERFSIIVKSKGDPIKCYEGDKVTCDNGTILVIGDGEIIVEKQPFSTGGVVKHNHTKPTGNHTHSVYFDTDKQEYKSYEQDNWRWRNLAFKRNSSCRNDGLIYNQEACC